MVYATSRIIILRSKNTEDWDVIHSFGIPDRDVRDPHFLIFQDKLFLYTGTWYAKDLPDPYSYDMNKQLGFVVYSEDGVSWSKPKDLTGLSGYYIWKAGAYGGNAYLSSRRNINFAPAIGETEDIESVLLKSADGFNWHTQLILQDKRGDENAFIFSSDGNLLAIARGYGDDDALLIQSKFPFNEVLSSTSLGKFIGGPMISTWGDKLLVVLLTPASPGWFIWILPLLVSYQVSGDRTAVYITSIFSALYVFSALLFVGSQQIDLVMQVLGLHANAGQQISNTEWINSRLSSLIHTALVATGIVLAIRIWRETVIRNDFFRLSRKPFVIGVAGDSGAGKDTFANAISGLFGSHSVAAISGDDYHLWDRHQPMWKVMTHINPAANDLESFAKNLVSLTDGRSVQASHYDHDTGKMGRPFTIQSNDIIIASGLHALYLPILRECCDLRIYLDIDEGLRTYFKVQRDVNTRGYTIERVLDALAKRKPDSEKFIRPQVAFADLIFSLRPINPSALNNANESNPPRLKLVVKSRHGFNEISLKRVLIGVCGLHVDMNTNADVSEVELSIEGETSAQDIKMAARLICPQTFEFLDLQPQWQNGVLGLMQLITLSHINQALTRRFI